MTPPRFTVYQRRGQWRWADVVPVPPQAGIDAAGDKQLRGAVEWQVVCQASPEDMTSLAPWPPLAMPEVVPVPASVPAPEVMVSRRGFWVRVWSWLTRPIEALP